MLGKLITKWRKVSVTFFIMFQLGVEHEKFSKFAPLENMQVHDLQNKRSNAVGRIWSNAVGTYMVASLYGRSNCQWPRSDTVFSLCTLILEQKFFCKHFLKFCK